MSENNIPPHKQRMIDEHKELADRMHKLHLFTENSPVYIDLPQIEKILLAVQYKAMDTYNECLKQRIILS